MCLSASSTWRAPFRDCFSFTPWQAPDAATAQPRFFLEGLEICQPSILRTKGTTTVVPVSYDVYPLLSDITYITINSSRRDISQSSNRQRRQRAAVGRHNIWYCTSTNLVNIFQPGPSRSLQREASPPTPMIHILKVPATWTVDVLSRVPQQFLGLGPVAANGTKDFKLSRSCDMIRVDAIDSTTTASW